MSNFAFDYDGVITANYQHYHQLIKDLIKSKHEVYILTGANWLRYIDILNDLRKNDINTHLIIRPQNFKSTSKNIGLWKKEMLIAYKIDFWWDNEIKVYEQAGVRFDDIETQLVRI